MLGAGPDARRDIGVGHVVPHEPAPLARLHSGMLADRSPKLIVTACH